MMTRPLKTAPKTASRALFLRRKGLKKPKKDGKPQKTPPAVTYRGDHFKKNFTGKEPDPETGLYYYGARYLDPKTSRWISGDPALGDYLPVAPVNDEAKKRNGNLPGMGGVFNVVNMHAYHYAGNNPVVYVDPDGRLQRDTDGNFIFEETEKIIAAYPTPEGKYEWSNFQKGYLLAEDGTKIEASINLDKSKPGFDTNCHGWTFTDGQYWINDDQVDAILKHDGYEKHEQPQAGDVVVYNQGRENIVHSAKIVHSIQGTPIIIINENAGNSTAIKQSRIENGIYTPSWLDSRTSGPHVYNNNVTGSSTTYWRRNQ
jgi:RHS repeat-associated protein